MVLHVTRRRSGSLRNGSVSVKPRKISVPAMALRQSPCRSIQFCFSTLCWRPRRTMDIRPCTTFAATAVVPGMCAKPDSCCDTSRQVDSRTSMAPKRCRSHSPAVVLHGTLKCALVCRRLAVLLLSTLCSISVVRRCMSADAMTDPLALLSVSAPRCLVAHLFWVRVFLDALRRSSAARTSSPKKKGPNKKKQKADKSPARKRMKHARPCKTPARATQQHENNTESMWISMVALLMIYIVSVFWKKKVDKLQCHPRTSVALCEKDAMENSLTSTKNKSSPLQHSIHKRCRISCVMWHTEHALPRTTLAGFTPVLV